MFDIHDTNISSVSPEVANIWAACSVCSSLLQELHCPYGKAGQGEGAKLQLPLLACLQGWDMDVIFTVTFVWRYQCFLCPCTHKLVEGHFHMFRSCCRAWCDSVLNVGSAVSFLALQHHTFRTKNIHSELFSNCSYEETKC